MIRLLVCLLLLLAPLSAMADTVRVGIFVGNDIGFGQDEPLGHAEREARDMARVFQEMGDIPRERTFLVTGQQGPRGPGHPVPGRPLATRRCVLR